MLLSWRLGLGRIESVDDYVGVLVPLEQAHLYSYSAREGTSIAMHEMKEKSKASDEEQEGEDMGMLDAEGVEAGEYTIEGLRRELRQSESEKAGKRRGNDFEVKSKLINKAVQDIGMGTYQWHLFILCGFGWMADNLWLQGVSLILPSLSAEFDISEKAVRFTTSAVFIGLAVGSFLWGMGSDIMGRRIAFNTTLFITAVFGIMAAYAQTWAGVCFFLGALGFGVGGSLPVDGALFLEFLPSTHSSLLTLLSAWWPVGQLVSSLVAWYFIGQWPAEEGWRYFIVTIGIVTFAMFVVRYFVFHMFESPKYLLTQGRQKEAVAVIHGLAYRCGTKTWLTSEIMDAVAAVDDDETAELHVVEMDSGSSGLARVVELVKAKVKKVSGKQISALFESKTLATTVVLIWFCWAAIGLGYPLYNAFLVQFLAHSSSDPSSETSTITAETYRNYAITSVMGVPGSLLAAYLVDRPSPFLGRRGTLACSTLLSAIFLFLFVSLGTTPGAQLAFSCVGAFTQNIMYGVLYAFTPEVFPTPVRGAGNGVASFLNRVFGLAAPVLAALMPGDGATLPIYLSAVLILLAFVAMCLIPMETRGAQML